MVCNVCQHDKIILISRDGLRSGKYSKRDKK